MKINELKLGDSIKINHPLLKRINYSILAKSDDEIILGNSNQNKKDKSTLIMADTKLKDYKLKNNEQVEVILPQGKKIKMYVSILIGKESIILSTKKNPTNSSIKWVLRLLTNGVL